MITSINEFRKLNENNIDNIKNELLINIEKKQKEIDSLENYMKNGTPHNNNFTMVLNDLSTKRRELEQLKGRLDSISESLRSDLYNKEIVDLSNYKYAYHWLNDGNFFDQIYAEPGTQDQILRKYDGKKLEMSPLPPVKFILGGDGDGDGVCLTLDPEYLQAGVTGESNICLVFEIADLMKYGIENLTNNGEAEIRVKKITEWDKIVKHIFIPKKIYEVGDGWEGFYYRAIKEWLPENLKNLTTTLPSVKSIGKTLKTNFYL